MQLRRSQRKTFLGVLSVFLAIGGIGCYWENNWTNIDRNEMVKYFSSGFKLSPSNLFIDNGRIVKLLTCSGYDANKYSYYCDHSSDGTLLRCWNYDRTSAVVIQHKQKPMIVTTPERAFLDDHNNVVAYVAADLTYSSKVTCANGTEIIAPNFILSAEGRVFCYGGNFYDHKTGTIKTFPIKLAFVESPSNPVATSELKGLLAGVFVAGNNIYVVTRDSEHCLCEEYERDGFSVVRKRRFEIVPPSAIISWVIPADFDPVSRSFLIKVGRDLPLLGGPVWYVYDIKTGKFREVGVFDGYAAFLDRCIFDRMLEELAE